MCELFIKADAGQWQSRTHSLRIDGVATSIRIENHFWDTLGEIGLPRSFGCVVPATTRSSLQVKFRPIAMFQLPTTRRGKSLPVRRSDGAR